MSRRQTDAEFVRQLLRDATSTSKRQPPARRSYAVRVLNAALDRAERECPQQLRQHTQAVIHAVHRNALAGDAASIALHRESAARFRADGYDVPDLPPTGDHA